MTGNPYHDQQGKFCSAREMRSAFKTMKAEAYSMMTDSGMSKKSQILLKQANDLEKEYNEIKSSSSVSHNPFPQPKSVRPFFSTSLSGIKQLVTNDTGSASVKGIAIAGIAAVAVGATVFGIVSHVTGSNMPAPTKDHADSSSVLQTLDNASQIDLNKDVISFGDNWHVKVNGQEVASVKGQVITTLGDTYTMTSPSGNTVATEAENAMDWTRGATTYNDSNVKDGYIDGNFSVLLNHFTFEDANGNAIGTADQDFSLIGMQYTIKDQQGNVDYTIKKAVFSWGASLEVDKKDSDSAIPGKDAVWMALIANEIDEAQNNNDDD